MEKTKIEKFISNNDLHVEIEINKDCSNVVLYKKGDLFLYRFSHAILNVAIESAVQDYMERNKNE